MASWTNTFEEDPGWDTKLIINHDELVPMRNKILREKILVKRLACSSGGNIYVFNPNFNSWFGLMDIQTVIFLNNIMDLSMASVNYDKAFRGYIRYIESRSMDMGAGDIPCSVCVGSRRLAVQLIDDGLEFSLCSRVVSGLPMNSPSYDIVASLSYMSLDIKYFPPVWKHTYRFPLYRYMARFFQNNPIGFETLKWIVGKTLIDPTSFNKVLCLFGEGMKGKSKVIQSLMVALKGCIASIPENYLVSMNTGIPGEIKEMVVSNRIVTAGDVDSHFRKTNLAFIKSLTGQDYVSIPPTSVKSKCSLVYNTNKLDSPKDNPEWSTTAIARRYNVVHMNTNVPGGVDEEVPQDVKSRADFVCQCVYTVLKNPEMPMSLQDLIMTLLLSEIFEAHKYLAYIDASTADDQETVTANAILASFMKVDVHQVGELASKRTRRHLKSIDGIDYVVGVVPSIHYGK